MSDSEENDVVSGDEEADENNEEVGRRGQILSVIHCLENTRVKSGNFGHQLNLDMYWQTVEILMRRLLMSRLIRIFTVC